jgi:hypothetical protein
VGFIGRNRVDKNVRARRVDVLAGRRIEEGLTIIHRGGAEGAEEAQRS